MKTFFFKFVSIFGLLAFATPALAQGMMGTTYWSTVKSTTDSNVQQEEALGAELWQKMQKQELTCVSVTDKQFELLGEYFMGQMMGDAHAAMNARMQRSLGEAGEEQMHITLGKRLSGCNPDAVYANGYLGFMPMMGMMFINNAGWDGSYAYRSPMMQSMYSVYGSRGWVGWVIILLWWILVITAITVFVRWVMNLQTGHPGHIELLKSRYAKGEIDKRTFDRMKKELK